MNHEPEIRAFSEAIHRAITDTALEPLECAAVLVGIVAYIFKAQFRDADEREVIVSDASEMMHTVAMNSREIAMEQIAARVTSRDRLN